MSLSVEQFVEKLDEIGLLSTDEVSRVTDNLPADRQPADVPSLAKILIREGKLTKYQATAVYQDKSKHLVMGPYVVIDRIGAGGMGQVLKAVHRTMDREVALKILPPAKVNSADSVKRFHQEVRAAAKLLHPNIVAAHDAGEYEGMHYLVMEYVEGADLSSVVKEQGRLPIEQALDYIIQAASGLGFAHEKGIVHRDIKPGNLLLSTDGVVKILDMGLARLNVGELNEAGGGEGDGLTQSGQVMGTIDYMAPEQALDTRRADHRADIYALGCTLYRLVTGETPFAGDTMMMKLLAHREEPIPSLREFRPEVSPALDEVYQRMMAKNPEDRQQSMAEVAVQLQAALAGPVAPPPARPAAAPAPPRAAEQPPADSALSAFLQTGSQPAATTAKKKRSTSAFEETIDHGSSDEGTGDRLEHVEPLDMAAGGVGVSAVAASPRHVPSGRRDVHARKPWLIPAIAGGTVGLVIIVGLIVAFALRGSGNVEVASDESADAALARSDQPMPNDPPAQASSTAPRTNSTPPATPNAEAGQADPPPPLPPPDYGPGAPPLAVAPFEERQAKDHQNAWADFLSLPVEKEIELPGGEKMSFMLIPPGEFMMGSTAEEQVKFLEEAKAANDKWSVTRIPSEGPQHRVRITQPFYFGKYELTQAQWQAVMGNMPSKFKDNPTHPVEQVSWDDIQPFLAKLNEGASAGQMKFALPTEAQWEYACRAGTTKYWHCGDSEEDLRQYGWFHVNSGSKTDPVGQLRNNPFGLYDLHGNVWEWCADCYDADYYAKAPVADPNDSLSGSYRVNRGGAWDSHAGHCRSADRLYQPPDVRASNLGVRLAMTIPESVWRDEAIATQTADGVGWTSLFNGRDLTNWDGDPRVWSVEDGAITGRTTPQNAIKANTCLIWRGGQVDDFELQVKFRIESGNSGIQFRSKTIGPWTMSGYQADFDAQKLNFVGGLYEELGRGMLAEPGTRVTRNADGSKPVFERVTPPTAIVEAIKPNDWNDYHITARGNRIVQEINGVETAEFVDDDSANAALSGLLGLQVHQGPPMTVQFKDIFLRPLDDDATPSENITPPPQQVATENNNTILPDDKWVDILPMADTSRDVVDGDWKSVGDAMQVTGSKETLARLMLPVVPKGSYALEVGLTRTKGDDDVAVLLPVGDRSVVFHTSAFSKWVGIDMIGGAAVFKTANPTHAASPVKTGTPVKVQVAAMLQEDQVRFIIQMDGEKMGDVNVPIAELGEHEDWHADLTDKSRLALGADEVEAVIDYVKLKMLDGQAELLAADRESVALDTDQNEASNEWTDLLAGGRLDSWNVDNDPGAWNIENGVLKGADGKGLLLTHHKYSDFELKLEFRLPARGNGGVFLRVDGPQTYNGGRCVEVQITDDNVNPEDQTGSIKDLVPKQASPKVGPLQWHAAQIRCVGSRVSVTVDGHQTVDTNLADLADMLKTRTGYNSTVGNIGLQRWGSSVEYRNIQIRDVSTTTSKTRNATPNSSEDDDNQWITLFNGRDLNGWQPVGDPKLWNVANGAIVTDGKGNDAGWLSTTREFSDFVLQFEFQLPANGNSGVFLRAPREGPINGGNFLEIALQDDATDSRGSNFTGSAYGLAERKVAGALFPASSGKWNQMEIRAVGSKIQVALNGRLINEFDLQQVHIPARLLANGRRASGYIGLQCNRTGAAFRNIRIRPLK